MQPYQLASEEIERQGEFPIKAAKVAGKLASGFGAGALGGLALNKVLPFLSEYVPAQLAMKGLEKIDKRFGSFFKKALAHGKTVEEARDFIKEKIAPAEKAQADEMIAKEGSSLLSKQQMGSKTMNVTKRPFPGMMESSAVEQPQAAQPVQPMKQAALGKFNQHKQKQGLIQQEHERFQQQYGQQQGGLDPSVQQILQQGNAILARIKGQQ